MEEREKLKAYFAKCYRSLAKNGLLVIDCFGGPEYLMPHSDKRRNSEMKFNYWWEVTSFDALSHRMTCKIHYQRDGEAIRKNVFAYHWRLWGVPEITDILNEVGFKEINYWSEGLDKNGMGNGRFRPITKETGCKAWVCYLVAKK
jgi:cyclopropane fatty-acyl-phospholipid synthase-like methyltransferase